MENQEKKKLREALLTTVKQQIRTYPVYTAKMKLKYRIKQCLGKKQAPIDRFFWPHAMLSYALMEAHKVTGSTEALAALTEYVDRYMQAGVPLYYVDNVMNGEALLYLHRQTGKPEYLQVAEKLARYVQENGNATRAYMREKGLEAVYDGSLIYRSGNPTHVYVDALGMVCPMLTHIGVMQKKDDRESAEQNVKRSLAYLQRFLEKAMDAVSGLPYHGYDIVSGEKMGIIGWGRAVGWLLMALSGSLQYVSKEAYAGEAAKDSELFGAVEALTKQFEELVKTTFSYQKEDGLFAWQLQATEGPADTSATAMILYAVKQGMQSGALSEEYRAMVEKGEQGLLCHVRDGNVKQCLAECMGFAQYPQVYGCYPWGLAMTAAVLFMEEK